MQTKKDELQKDFGPEIESKNIKKKKKEKEVRAIARNDHDLCFHLSLFSYFCYQFDGAADLTHTT